MYYVITNKLINKMIYKGRLENKKINIYSIWIADFIAVFINFLVADGIGYTLKIENQLVAYGLFYTVMRNASGGSLLKLNVKNAVSRWIMGIALLVGINITSLSNVYHNFLMFALSMLSILIVMFTIPVRNQKIRMPLEVRIILKKEIILSIVILCIGLATLLFMENSDMVTAAIVGIFIQSLSLLNFSVDKREIINFESMAV